MFKKMLAIALLGGSLMMGASAAAEAAPYYHNHAGPVFRHGFHRHQVRHWYWDRFHHRHFYFTWEY